MHILAIETSCDDTGVCLLEAKKNGSFLVLADELASQAKMHSKFGGVYPALAKNEHIKNLPILLEKVLKKSKIKKPDLIAVTYGPGIEPCLWTGITFAQKLAKEWGCPIVPVNHMEGHIVSVFGKNKGAFKLPKTKFPILSLLVSGGHTELVVSSNYTKHRVIGKTLDDAVGEAYDKVARMLGLPYPGGPEISKLAELERKNLSLRGLASATARARGIFQQKNIRTPKEQIFSFSFPRPMLKSKDFNFSFSGLKTSVLYFIQKNPNVPKEKIALEFENAVVETLIYKTKEALEKYLPRKGKTKPTLIVGGGVSANKHLRRELKKSLGKKYEIFFPNPKLARDNAVMIGIAGFLEYQKGKTLKPEKIKAEGNLKL